MQVRGIRRRLGWDRNPLRRGSDRFEGWLNLVLILVLLVAGTFLAAQMAGSAYRAEKRAAAWERAHRHQVWAVLLERAGPDTAALPTARARWTAPDRTVHVGVVPATRDAAAGTRLQIWVDDRGNVTGPPSRRRPGSEATRSAIVVVVALAAALVAVRVVARRVLDRRRMRSWSAEWMEVGPRWSRYR